jgi:hypothetical protein
MDADFKRSVDGIDTRTAAFVESAGREATERSSIPNRHSAISTH